MWPGLIGCDQSGHFSVDGVPESIKHREIPWGVGGRRRDTERGKEGLKVLGEEFNPLPTNDAYMHHELP